MDTVSEYFCSHDYGSLHAWVEEHGNLHARQWRFERQWVIRCGSGGGIWESVKWGAVNVEVPRSLFHYRTSSFSRIATIGSSNPHMGKPGKEVCVAYDICDCALMLGQEFKEYWQEKFSDDWNLDWTLEYWRVGGLEGWHVGMLECWNIIGTSGARD